MTTSNSCCADSGVAGGASLKVCKSCMLVRYCNAAACQANHWPTHKPACKQRAAELRDEALFKVPPAKEDCPICFLSMLCYSLPDATASSVPIYDFADANNVELGKMDMDTHYPRCGKIVCRG